MRKYLINLNYSYYVNGVKSTYLRLNRFNRYKKINKFNRYKEINRFN